MRTATAGKARRATAVVSLATGRTTTAPARAATRRLGRRRTAGWLHAFDHFGLELLLGEVREIDGVRLAVLGDFRRNPPRTPLKVDVLPPCGE